MTPESIARLSDEELSRLIAEEREPSPAWVKHFRVRRQRNDRLSDGGMWWAEDHHIHANDTLDDVGNKHVMDMVTDQAMTMMLIASGISIQVEPNPLQDEHKFCAYVLDTKISVSGENCGRVVAERYALWKGLK